MTLLGNGDLDVPGLEPVNLWIGGAGENGMPAVSRTSPSCGQHVGRRPPLPSRHAHAVVLVIGQRDAALIGATVVGFAHLADRPADLAGGEGCAGEPGQESPVTKQLFPIAVRLVRARTGAGGGLTRIEDAHRTGGAAVRRGGADRRPDCRRCTDERVIGAAQLLQAAAHSAPTFRVVLAGAQAPLLGRAPAEVDAAGARHALQRVVAGLAHLNRSALHAGERHPRGVRLTGERALLGRWAAGRPGPPECSRPAAAARSPRPRRPRSRDARSGPSRPGPGRSPARLPCKGDGSGGCRPA